MINEDLNVLFPIAVAISGGAAITTFALVDVQPEVSFAFLCVAIQATVAHVRI